jgi:hypothetical protein
VVDDDVQYSDLTGPHNGDGLELELDEIAKSEYSSRLLALEVGFALQEIEFDLVFYAHWDEFGRRYPEYSDEAMDRAHDAFMAASEAERKHLFEGQRERQAGFRRACHEFAASLITDGRI